MAKRPSLKTVTAKPDAAEAAKVAAQIKGNSDPARVANPEAAGSLKTVSYNLPVEIVDLLRDLARKRADEVRAARARGDYTDGDARTSASKIVLGALAPHVDAWRAELDGG
jgi:hypothetical protein